jgi:hypothetical protein
MVLIGALIVANVVLVLEYVPLGAWTRLRPSWHDIVLRTALYAFGVFVVMIIEKAFEARHESGGFGPALMGIFRHADIYHVWANTIVVTGALLVFNTLSVIRRHLGKGELIRLFLTPLPENHDHR